MCNLRLIFCKFSDAILEGFLWKIVILKDILQSKLVLLQYLSRNLLSITEEFKMETWNNNLSIFVYKLTKKNIAGLTFPISECIWSQISKLLWYLPQYFFKIVSHAIFVHSYLGLRWFELFLLFNQRSEGLLVKLEVAECSVGFASAKCQTSMIKASEPLHVFAVSFIVDFNFWDYAFCSYWDKNFFSEKKL